MRLFRFFLPLAIFAFLFQASSAQSTDWAIVQQLAPSQKVKIVTTDGKSRMGTARSITDEGIQIGKEQPIPRGDVQQILLWSPGHHGRNALVGLAIGAGIGVGFGASCGKDSFVSRTGCIAVGAPLFGGVGAGIGALIPSRGQWREIYRSK